MPWGQRDCEYYYSIPYTTPVLSRRVTLSICWFTPFKVIWNLVYLDRLTLGKVAPDKGKSCFWLYRNVVSSEDVQWTEWHLIKAGAVFGSTETLWVCVLLTKWKIPPSSKLKSIQVKITKQREDNSSRLNNKWCIWRMRLIKRNSHCEEKNRTNVKLELRAENAVQ